MARQTTSARGYLKGQPLRWLRGHSPRDYNHHLTDLDESTRTATCSRCGLITVRLSEGRWRCYRRLVTSHILSDIDPQARVAQCRECKTIVPIWKSGDRWGCAITRRATNRQWHSENKERSAATTKAWREVNRDQLRARQRAKKYGLTVEQFEDLLSAQDGGCAVCHKLFGSSKNDVPHVDHCHDTGVVRGLLCGRCNTAIGLMRDDPTLLRAAASYLTKARRKGETPPATLGQATVHTHS